MTVDGSVLISGAVLLAGVVASHIRMETRLNEFCNLLQEVRRAIGMSNGANAKFVPTGECVERHSEIRRELDRIESKLDEILASRSGAD